MDGVLFRDDIKVVYPWKTVEIRYRVQEEIQEWKGERNSQVCDAEIP
jgi:hypothetical protein